MTTSSWSWAAPITSVARSSRRRSRAAHEVTTLNRGLSGTPVAGAEARHADRTDADALAAALGDDTWDAVVDTWSFAPRRRADLGAAAVGARAGHYTYISSRSVYTWPIPHGVDESAPVVDGDPEPRPPTTPPTSAAASWRPCEFDGEVLLARAGLILGPYERVGRMPFWFRRISAGGRVPAPGPHDRPVAVHRRPRPRGVRPGPSGRHVRHREPPGAHHDRAAARRGRPGQRRRRRAGLADPARRSSAPRSSGWTELPIWAPPTGELAAPARRRRRQAYDAGLRCRPMPDTLRDTWAWLQAEGYPAGSRGPGTGLDARGRGAAVGRAASEAGAAARPTRWGDPSFGLVSAKA